MSSHIMSVQALLLKTAKFVPQRRSMQQNVWLNANVLVNNVSVYCRLGWLAKAFQGEQAMSSLSIT